VIILLRSSSTECISDYVK